MTTDRWPDPIICLHMLGAFCLTARLTFPSVLVMLAAGRSANVATNESLLTLPLWRFDPPCTWPLVTFVSDSTTVTFFIFEQSSGHRLSEHWPAFCSLQGSLLNGSMFKQGLFSCTHLYFRQRAFLLVPLRKKKGLKQKGCEST